MCPLRFILVFLSATLAGFFILRNLKSEPPQLDTADDETHHDPKNSPNRFTKVRFAMESGFWTFVDMASGRYLWRNLVSSSSTKPSD